ncbi:hypothetical protein [Treponema primitia]|uniref:hypothetical protein n=1 Tax=Treponema primitia TaxID=88058 RepID=UPI000255526F|nr:hypothetical protein [Treponema primitia]
MSKRRLQKRTVTKRKFPGIFLGGSLLLLTVMVIGAITLYKNWPRPTWYVEAGLEKQWGELLEKAPSPPPFTRLRVYDPVAGIKKGQYGIIITKDFLAGQSDIDQNSDTNTEAGGAPAEAAPPWEPPIRVFPQLYQNRTDYQGTIPLALDPWLILRKTGDPQLSLERIRNPAGGAGSLIIPGAEADAVHAWLCQLLQDSPGSFPQDQRTWDAAKERLIYGNRRFQQGALTYTWFDVWLTLLRNDPAWVYAPLSMARELSAYDAGRLDATLFPIPSDWNTYGLQADILWAIPEAPDKLQPKLDPAKTWLAAPETQALIAEILGWIPAHPNGKPHDTMAREAQVAWFSSAFIWHSR